MYVNFPVIMLGEFQDTEINLDVMLNIEKFCGGSSGAETHRINDFYKCSKFLETKNKAQFASFFHT